MQATRTQLSTFFVNSGFMCVPIELRHSVRHLTHFLQKLNRSRAAFFGQKKEEEVFMKEIKKVLVILWLKVTLLQANGKFQLKVADHEIL